VDESSVSLAVPSTDVTFTTNEVGPVMGEGKKPMNLFPMLCPESSKVNPASELALALVVLAAAVALALWP